MKLSESELMLKCLEMAVASNPIDVVETAERYYNFVMHKTQKVTSKKFKESNKSTLILVK